MVTPDWKVRKLMEAYQKTGSVSRAALRADMDRKTARKYLRLGKLPSQLRVQHTWRTRSDPGKNREEAILHLQIRIQNA